MSWSSRSSTRVLAAISLAGAATFVVCTGIAIAVFPGGTRDDARPTDYLFWQNFLSDLGGTFTGSGRPNGTARAWFVVAMVAVAISLVALAIASRAWSAGRGGPVRWLPAVAALPSGVAFVRAAAIPWNVDYYRHMAWVRGAFGLLGAMVAAIALLQFLGRAPWGWLLANVGFVVALLIYVAYDQQGPDLTTVQGIEAQVRAQKAIVALAILNLAGQAFALTLPQPRASRSSVGR